MSAWRRKAIEAAPDLRDRLQQCRSPMAAWLELRPHFIALVKSGDLPGAQRIMAYARYCLAAPGAEVNTAVALAFIEHLADDDAVLSRLAGLASALEMEGWRAIMAYHAPPQRIDRLIETAQAARPR